MESSSPSRALRIAIDARYVREKPSGIGAYVQALVERLPSLAASDHFFFWAHPLAPRPLSPAPNTSATIVKAGPNSPWPVLWPEHYASFAEVDVFHSPHNLMPRGLPCASVITVHDVMALEEPAMHLQGLERVVKSVYYRQAVWRALREATRLVAQSRATADRICALLPEAAKRLTVIWSAPDRDLGPPNDPAAAQERAARLTKSEAPYLLLVGANTPSKRHDLALAAFGRAVPRPWLLVVVQRRKASKGLVRLAKQLQVDDRVVWLETVARPDLVTLLQAAGGLIQPSVYEGFGLPVLEAMACGCPVVASDIPPLREVTAGTALLFKAGDVTGLANALRDFVQSPGLRESLAGQGLARSRDFSWDRCAKETLAVYHDAVATNR
ncbi:MAG TPA: glycosyltransferase family 1 protein [Chthoniobacterales bacterium]|nr:glycosyltransferase family 1 protein [Chthoniobacterales bacterium]